MSAPTVACVMLANGRPEMVKRAVKSFRAQTYDGARLLVFDSGPIPLEGIGLDSSCIAARFEGWNAPIGTLRNMANDVAKKYADIICHWDSDDWSHPNRIAEQVALLQSNSAECVGYNEMLFWKVSASVDASIGENHRYGAAWLYRAAVPNYAIGTSMCYWRSTWEQHPFPDRSEGCDDLEWFNKGVKIEAASSIPPMTDPLMIASIHGGNTCARIDAKAREWTRVPELDAYCREAMEL